MASVERGFSVNKELVVENQSEQTLAARKIIKDHIIHVNRVTDAEITRNMVLTARSARAKYANYFCPTKGRTGGRERNKKKKRNTWIRGQMQTIEDRCFFPPFHFKGMRSARKVESYR